MAKSEEKRHEPRRGWLKYGNPSGDFNKAPRCTLNRSKLLQVSPVDPEIFAITAFVFPVVTLLSTFMPAWRAARVDPITALRDE
jgi:hypothetical protein